MKLNYLKCLSLVGALTVGAAPAQETNELELLRKEIRELRTRTQALEQKLDSIEHKPAAVVAPPKEIAAAPVTAPSLAVASPWKPTDPISLGRAGSAYMNMSFDALVAAGGSTAKDIDGGTQLGGHDPKQRGFTVQNLEITLDGNVDPFLRGQANIVLQIDPRGDTTIEAEEAYLETVSLPWNLQLKAGQYFTEFGRLNPQHPHSWAFADQPLVNGRFFGEDGLRSAGARMSWLVPTPFYSELFFGVQNSQGGTAFSFRDDHGGKTFFDRLNGARGVKSFSDMLFTTRYAASFDLTDTQTLLAGASAAFGPNSSGNNTDTQIYGVDLYWKWKSPRAHGGFPFVVWQSEALLRRYQAGAFNWDLNGNGALDPGEQDANGDMIPDLLPRETVTDWGLYSQVLWGFKPGWVAGIRGDFVTGDTAKYEKLYGADLARATRWRVSPNLTWYPSEFSKIRLQYNYDDRDGIGVDHSLWLQFEFLLGAHAAHKF